MLKKTNLILFIAITLLSNVLSAMEKSIVTIPYTTIIDVNKFIVGDCRSIDREHPIKQIKISTNKKDTKFFSLHLRANDDCNNITLKRTETNIEVYVDKQDCFTLNAIKLLATLPLNPK